MKPASWIRSLLFVAGLSACASEVLAHDILVNGNFAQGKAHWKGDGKDASGSSIDDISASMGSQGQVSGMLVNLKHGITYVSQMFRSGDTALTLSITYTTSADFNATGAAHAGAAGGPLGSQNGTIDAGGPITDILGFPVIGQLPTPGKDQAVALIADPSQNAVISALIPFPASPGGPHTSTITFDRLMAHEDKTLYLFLPPGEGSVTFSQISLAKPGAAPSSDTPFQP